jgi:serine/threonine-protein kinase SRPK3
MVSLNMPFRRCGLGQVSSTSDLLLLSEAKILLTDFGESSLPSTTQRYYSDIPETLLPPEARFSPQEPLSFPSDIRALACDIWALLARVIHFSRLFFRHADIMIEMQVDLLVKLPPEWWQK